MGGETSECGRRRAAAALFAAAVLVACGAGDANEAVDPTRAGSTSPVAEDTRAALLALGYADAEYTDPISARKSGVTAHDPARAFAGYTLFNSRRESHAQLIDMDGRVVHEWLAPDLEGSWHHVELLSGGDLLVIRKGGYLARLDWNSNLRWERDLLAHHDVAVSGADTDAGDVHVLGLESREIERNGRPLTVLADVVASYTAAGEPLGRVSLLDLFGDRIDSAHLARLARDRARSPREFSTRIDVFHTNTLEWIDRDIAGMATAGDFLICLRELDTVAIVDLDEGRVEWSFGPGVLDRPHQPTLTDDDRILIFDNGMNRGFSRVIEVDPATDEIVWSYNADPLFSFFTRHQGGVQALPNDNVLITESARGRAFEITRDDEIVWDFHNPDLRREGNRTTRGALYRTTRIPEQEIADVLESFPE